MSETNGGPPETDVFTTLTMAKMELNGGVIPAMTPLTDRAKKICDPEFTPGMGALEADPETTKLRCPIKGCGEYRHQLAKHLNSTHRDVGGRDRVVRVLQLPPDAALVSPEVQARLKENGRTVRRGGTCPATTNEGRRCNGYAYSDSTDGYCYMHWLNAEPGRRKNHQRAAAGKQGGRAQLTGVRNFHNTCRAQIAQRILSVRDRVGRVPSMSEARHYDPPLVGAIHRLYGWSGWNAALADCDLQTGTRTGGRYDKDGVLAMIAGFHDRHGRLPRRDEADAPTVPPMPSAEAIFNALGVDGWTKAMRVSARILGVDAGVYDTGLRDPVSTSDIAKAWGISIVAARNRLRRNKARGEICHGSNGSCKYWEKSDVDRIGEMYEPQSLESPVTTRTAARILGVGVRKAHHRLKEAGVRREVVSGGGAYYWERDDVEAVATNGAAP